MEMIHMWVYMYTHMHTHIFLIECVAFSCDKYM